MKKCSKCGVELPDDARFCNNCGANLSGDMTETSIEPSVTKISQDNEILANAKKANKNKKLGLVALVGAGALLILILFCIIISAISGGYKKPIKTIVKNINKQNASIDSYIDCFLPKYARKSYNSVYKLTKGNSKQAITDYETATSAVLYKLFADLKKEYGDDYKITLEYKNTEKLESDDKEWREIEDNWDRLADDLYNMNIDDDDFWSEFGKNAKVTYNSKQLDKLSKIGDTLVDDIDATKIQGAYEVKLKVNIKGSTKNDTQKLDFYVVKVNGKWIIDPASSLYMFTPDALEEF